MAENDDARMGAAADVLDGWNGHNGIQLAGSLAFFGALSAAPLIVVGAVAASLLLGQKAASGDLVAQLTPIVGAGAAKGLQSAALAAMTPGRGIAATVVAVVGTLFGAAGVVVQMRGSLDMILGRQDLGPIRGALGDWLSATTAVFAIGVAAVVALTAWAAVASATLLTGPLESLATGIATSAILFGLTGLGYRFLPSRRPAWPIALAGAGLAVAIAVAATLGMSVYVWTGLAASVYGAAASFFLLLMWLWFIGIGFILGAELVRVLVGRAT